MLTAGAISLVKPLAWQGVALVSGCVGFPVVLMAGELILMGGAGVAKAMGGAPTSDRRLHELASKAAAAVDVPEPKVYLVESREPNAFAASSLLGADTTVAVTSGLREVLTDEELGAVLAHEMGHLRHRDVVRNMHIATAAAGMGGLYEAGRLLLDSTTREKRSRSKKSEGEGGGALVGLGLMGAGLVSQGVAHMFRLAASRTAELKADRAAAEVFGADAMVSALKKIQAHASRRPADLRGGRAGRAYAHLMISDGPSSSMSKKDQGMLEKIGNALRTHPPVDERVAALEKAAANGEVPRRAPSAAWAFRF